MGSARAIAAQPTSSWSIARQRIGERHLGHLSTLPVWHEQDQVDHAERRRNDVIFAWQSSRNPFVDHRRAGAEHLDKCLSIFARLWTAGVSALVSLKLLQKKRSSEPE